MRIEFVKNMKLVFQLNSNNIYNLYVMIWIASLNLHIHLKPNSFQYEFDTHLL